MSNTKQPPVARATALINRPKGTDAQRTQLTASISQAMTASPDWATATDLQAAVKIWTSDATALGTNASLIMQLREQLKTANGKQRALRTNWTVSTAHMLSTATVLCNGDPERVTALSLDVETRRSLGPLGEVQGLAVNPGKASGEVVATWTVGDAKHGFMVQHAIDPTNAATMSTPQPSTRSRFSLVGAPGATVSFRVAAIDPTSATGMGPWTSWVVGNGK